MFSFIFFFYGWIYCLVMFYYIVYGRDIYMIGRYVILIYSKLICFLIKWFIVLVYVCNFIKLVIVWCERIGVLVMFWF